MQQTHARVEYIERDRKGCGEGIGHKVFIYIYLYTIHKRELSLQTCITYVCEIQTSSHYEVFDMKINIYF